MTMPLFTSRSAHNRKSNVAFVASLFFLLMIVFGCVLNRFDLGGQYTLADDFISSRQSRTSIGSADENDIRRQFSTWETKTKPCNKDDTVQKPIPNDKYYTSQQGEDKQLETWFHDLCGGTYVEMGALDGMKFSNSYRFHKAMNWKGVLIEASVRNYENLVKNRPNEIALVHAAACEQSRDLHWVDSRVAVGGFVEFASETFQQRWWSKEQIQNAQVVKCRPLREIFSEAVGENFFFDFFSLDVEGAELAVLRSLDFRKVGFGIIFVEFDQHNEMKNLAVKSLLKSNGYSFEFVLDGSGWFVNDQFHEIYKDVIYARDK